MTMVSQYSTLAAVLIFVSVIASHASQNQSVATGRCIWNHESSSPHQNDEAVCSQESQEPTRTEKIQLSGGHIQRLKTMQSSEFAKLSKNAMKISDKHLRLGILIGTSAYNSELRAISRLPEAAIGARPGSSSAAHFRFFQSSARAIRRSNEALRIIMASTKIAELMKMTPTSAMATFYGMSTNGTFLSNICPIDPICQASKYRTIDGSCNNLNKPLMGKHHTTMQRLLPPQYADGIFEPRRSVTGSKLPSPRLLSSVLVPDANNPRSNVALITMTFAQFVDHDFNLAPVFTTRNGGAIECCTSTGDFLPSNQRHPRCFPIDMPPDDPVYGKKKHCMNFVRSLPGLRPDCTLGYADQQTELTHWLDGSQIYGSTDELASNLRRFTNGKLRTGDIGGSNSLPTDGSSKECGGPCFLGGDVRAGENQLLTSMHTLWMREHNRVADELAQLNPTWNDETLYQESRRIVVAQYQHIVYNEFLPIILGDAYLKENNLYTVPKVPTTYDPTSNPSIYNEFAGAAFRMGHTLLQGIVGLYSKERNVEKTDNLSSMIFNSEPYKNPGFLDKIIRSLLQQPVQNFDSFITQEVTTKLFKGNSTFGLDLVALNIQRARDHGIPGYAAYRRLCHAANISTWEDLGPMMNPKSIPLFKKMYQSVDDIDLFLGGIHEQMPSDALVGPTFLCIIGAQFHALKTGDRFFYDLSDQPHSFRPEQLDEIRKSSLARIICDNNDGEIQEISPSAFHIASPTNARKDCNDPTIPRVDLTAWANELLF